MLSGICPRQDNDTAAKWGQELNVRMTSLMELHQCDFVDHNDNFLCRNGTTNDALLQVDGLHLSESGTTCLLRNLNLTESAVAELGFTLKQRRARLQSRAASRPMPAAADAPTAPAWPAARRRQEDERRHDAEFRGHRWHQRPSPAHRTFSERRQEDERRHDAQFPSHRWHQRPATEQRTFSEPRTNSWRPREHRTFSKPRTNDSRPEWYARNRYTGDSRHVSRDYDTATHDEPRRSSFRCWFCDEPGHMRKQCHHRNYDRC